MTQRELSDYSCARISKLWLSKISLCTPVIGCRAAHRKHAVRIFGFKSPRDFSAHRTSTGDRMGFRVRKDHGSNCDVAFPSARGSSERSYKRTSCTGVIRIHGSVDVRCCLSQVSCASSQNKSCLQRIARIEPELVSARETSCAADLRDNGVMRTAGRDS